MTNSKLKADLEPIVQEYGLGMVLKSLAEIADAPYEGADPIAASRNGAEKGNRQRKPKATAPEYVEKMQLGSEKSAAAAALAERFQQKSFLPSFGDVISFCQTYEIDPPASKSRENAIPRIFKRIAEMETAEIQRILDYEMFSGPSRLGPIADAIRNFGRSASERPAG